VARSVFVFPSKARVRQLDASTATIAPAPVDVSIERMSPAKVVQPVERVRVRIEGEPEHVLEADRTDAGRATCRRVEADELVDVRVGVEDGREQRVRVRVEGHRHGEPWDEESPERSDRASRHRCRDRSRGAVP
jgi:hypothetical protein